VHHDDDNDRLIGRRVLRMEDAPLLRGQGRFIANLDLPGAAHVAFVRSSVAHGRVTGIDTGAAREAPGVLDVVTPFDVDLPALASPPTMHPAMVRPLLPRERVRYVGEPLVAVVATSLGAAVDAAELVVVDIDPLPVVADAGQALTDEILLHPDAGTNLSFDSRVELPEGFFDDCEVVVDAWLHNTRQAPVPLEPRVGAAQWGGPDGGELTVWASCQRAHPPRDLLCEVYGLDPATVRVIVPDVGGSFGAKHAGTPEELLLPLLARRCGRPVRFVESRTENLVSLNHGRAQHQHVRLGGTRDGRLLAFALHVVREAGAFPAIGSTTRMTRVLTPGCYDIERVHYTAVAPVTNTAPTGSFRGAGRPEAAAAIERAVEMYAAEIGVPADDVRRRNFVRRFPHENGMGVAYDSGDYDAALQRALDALDAGAVRAEQARRRAAGERVLLGVGVSSYVEIANPLGAGEYGRVELTADGRLRCYTGSSPHGQGTHTAFAMLAADETGLPLDAITVTHGDTASVPRGNGTGGSRSLQTGGSAVALAARTLVDRAREAAADLLEANVDDVVLDRSGGRFHVAGTPAVGCTWADVAAAGPAERFRVEHDFGPTRPTFPFGAHVAVVEVDTDTGGVRLARFVAVDDCGVIVNPLLVEGQVHGGIAAGVAQALYEEIRYDADANPLATNLADYACISAAELPMFESVEMVTPTDANPLGAKGVGESGTTGSVPAVQNAVLDAIAHLGVRHLDVPLTPEKVWRAIAQASEPACSPASSPNTAASSSPPA
jgi:carbon-monoxide dehydrogenase large subunit